MKKATLLVVEDEKSISSAIEQLFLQEGYDVLVADTVFKAQGILAKNRPDLIILDRRLDDQDGLDFCKEIKGREETKDIPVLFLSAKKTAVDKVLGLKLGADDYVAKPYVPEELAARVEVLLRRTRAGEPQLHQLRCKDLWVDLDKRQAYIKDKPIDLWPKELDILQLFLQKRNHVLTRSFLLQRVWGADKELDITLKVVDVTVGRLRKKLGSYKDRIVAIRNYGYRFDDDS